MIASSRLQKKRLSFYQCCANNFFKEFFLLTIFFIDFLYADNFLPKWEYRDNSEQSMSVAIEKCKDVLKMQTIVKAMLGMLLSGRNNRNVVDSCTCSCTCTLAL